jgi:hypothetical protein
LIRHKYLTVQGKFLQESKKISNKSDGILDEIEKELINEVEIDYDDRFI